MTKLNTLKSQSAVGILRIAIGILFGAIPCCDGVAGHEVNEPFTTFSAGKADVVFSRNGKDYLRLGLAAWGPKWAWTGFDGQTRSENEVTTSALSAKLGGTNVPVHLEFRAAKPTNNQLVFQYALEAESDTDLTLIAVELSPGIAFEGQEVTVFSDGTSSTVSCPFGRRELGRSVQRMELTDSHGETTILRFEPPANIQSDGAARIELAAGNLPGSESRHLKMTVELPRRTRWYASVDAIPDEPGLDTWYPWQGTNQDQDSWTSLGDWIDRPAGKHGRIVRRDKDLFYNGRTIKLWGLNLCYGACAPTKELADRRATFYRKHGVNSVRLHKYADGPGWAGIQSEDSFVELDPEGLDRMDYQIASFKDAGIYVKLSAHFGTPKLGRDDEAYVPYLQEFGTPRKPGARVAMPHSAVHYSTELQHVQILQMTNLLQHRNPYTGIRYADDPAIAFIEIINEQSILFYSSMTPLKASQTLRKRIGAQFCAWLKQKYGNHTQLVAAWGQAALNSFGDDGFASAGEHLDRENILPLGNPWYWDPEQLVGSQAFRKQRLLDSLQFLYQLQCDFFHRYVKAVRGVGYDGEIVSSNWQAGRGFSHFANLHADSLVGTIDRHNYFGGSRANASMLERAGSGMLSTGMQQVADRPFMLSEWIHVFPNELGVEGPAIIGAYGLGLQGWDVSYMFQNGDDGTFSQRIGRQQWDVTAPQILGIFPAVSRQVLRGDVHESDVVAARNVHPASLFEGKLSFDDTVAQGYDDKELDSSKVPARALAVARSVVKFTPQYEETPVFSLDPYRSNGQLVSSTSQVRWREAQDDSRGFITIDTPGTKAVVGFAEGSVSELGNVTIEPQSHFGAIYVTARELQGSIDSSNELLVVAVARARNTGMKFSPDGAMMLAPGRSPVLMEPVKATISVRRSGKPQVIVLDHDGRLTDQTVPIRNGTFTIDAARDRSPYYLLRY
jgi:hypothetical protein